MPELRPLRPVRYAGPKGVDLSTKVAPPYDVLDEGPKRELLERDPHNIVAIDLPVTPPKTVGPDAAYAEAGETYRRWLAEGVLQREDEPSVLIYEQAYAVDGLKLRRRGLVCGLTLEEFNRPNGGIFRHEMTIAGGIGDRTKLMEATRAQLSPIFGVYPDPSRSMTEEVDRICTGEAPHFTATTGNDGVEHRCWWVTDKSTLEGLADFFRGTNVFIADGHHRYTTALQFSKEHGSGSGASGGLASGGEMPGADTCLFVLVAAEDEGMIVLPTHRVICGLPETMTRQRLEELVADDRRLRLSESAKSARFGLYLPSTGETVGLDTVDDPLAEVEAYADRPAVWRKLDVAILQHLVVDEVLGGADAGLTVKYTADLPTMKRMAAEGSDASGGGRMGVVMRATPLESVMAVSLAGDVMPAKSTYFYPKLATGLVINPLD